MELIKRLPGGEQSIAKRTIKDQVADKIAYMILSGLLQPGDMLPSERELAKTLAVSRETVRGAIAVLGTRRMIEVSQGSRTRVIGPAGQSLYESVSALGGMRSRNPEEVAEAREVVELQVIRLAAQRISDADIARLEALHADQRNLLLDPVGFQISDHQFHAIIYSTCGNSLLSDFVSDMYAYALDYRRQAMKRPGAIANSVNDHAKIVAALKTRDPELAAASMNTHLQRVRQTTLTEMAH